MIVAMHRHLKERLAHCVPTLFMAGNVEDDGPLQIIWAQAFEQWENRAMVLLHGSSKLAE